MKGFFYALCLFLTLSAVPGVGADSLEKPILYESSPYPLIVSAPQEQRDQKYVRLLEISLKIHVDGASGSGTICHYDEDSGLAHVVSCGHLWSGNMRYKKESELPKAKVVTWYKNGIKLDAPESFDAEVLFWSNERGYDVSLLRFTPNWKPNFAPIDESFELKEGMMLNSMGCDGGKEVARYEVLFKEFNSNDIITNRNSPRPGRSGGGLVTDCGKIVGVCWGTSDISSGKGIGYFTPVSSIKKVFAENEHKWLLELLGFKSIPIVDRENPNSSYDQGYIPFPTRF